MNSVLVAYQKYYLDDGSDLGAVPLGHITEGSLSQGAPSVLPSHFMCSVTQSCILGWHVLTSVN